MGSLATLCAALGRRWQSRSARPAARQSLPARGPGSRRPQPRTRRSGATCDPCDRAAAPGRPDRLCGRPRGSGSEKLPPRARATPRSPGAAGVTDTQGHAGTRRVDTPLLAGRTGHTDSAGGPRSPPPSRSAPSPGCQGLSGPGRAPPFLSPFPVFIFLHQTIDIYHSACFTVFAVSR